MTTHLHNLPTTEDDDQIRHLHRRKAVRDEHGHRAGALAQFTGGAGPPFKEAMLRLGIERGGWFIEQQEEGGAGASWRAQSPISATGHRRGQCHQATVDPIGLPAPWVNSRLKLKAKSIHFVSLSTSGLLAMASWRTGDME